MYNATVYRVLIASPGDLVDAREAACAAIHDWNRRFSQTKSIVLLPAMWEESLPSDLDRPPQAILNRILVDTSQICVALFWWRAGTPTRNQPGGAIEEIHRMRRRNCPTMAYFKDIPPPKDADPRQVKALVRFKKQLITQGGTIRGFSSLEQLRAKVCDDLSYAVTGADKSREPSPFAGTWLEIKRTPVERPYAIVSITSNEQGQFSVRGTSYTPEGKPCVEWPGKLDFAMATENHLFHAFDTKHPDSDVHGVACYSIPSRQLREYTTGTGYYAQQSSRGPLGSHRVEFDIIRITRRMFRQFTNSKPPNSISDYGGLIRMIHAQRQFPKVVLTGGPYSGKTTIIDSLKKLGHPTIAESAYSVMQNESRKRGKLAFLRWRQSKPDHFQYKVYQRQMREEKMAVMRCPKPRLLFMDRSAVDCISFLRLRECKVPPTWVDYAWTKRFLNVFILDTIRPYNRRMETLRRSTLEDSLRIRDQLIHDYRAFGYEPILIEEPTIEERIQTILNVTNSNRSWLTMSPHAALAQPSQI